MCNGQLISNVGERRVLTSERRVLTLNGTILNGTNKYDDKLKLKKNKYDISWMLKYNQSLTINLSKAQHAKIKKKASFLFLAYGVAY